MDADTVTILLVDDEEMVLGVTRYMLKQGGYKVLAASSAPKALTISRAHKGVIHLLISDIMMPEMNGIDLAAQLERERPGIRFLFITGYAGEHESRIKHPVLAKPFTLNELLQKVAEVLGRA